MSDRPIENVFATGIITVTVEMRSGVTYIGGFAGRVSGTVRNCYSESDVTVNASKHSCEDLLETGGFFGSTYVATGERDGESYRIVPNIEYCYAKGNVELNTGLGPSGYLGGFLGSAATEGSFVSCFMLGNVNGTGNGVASWYGKFVGYSSADLSGVRVSNSASCSGVGKAGPTVRGEEESRLKNVQWLISEFGFDGDIWAEEYGLPVLKAFSGVNAGERRFVTQERTAKSSYSNRTFGREKFR